MFFVFIVLLFVIPLGKFHTEQLNIIAGGIGTPLIFVIIGIFSIFGAADLWQKIYSTKNAKTAKHSAMIAGLLFFILGVGLTFVGMAAKNNFPEISPNEALYYGFFVLMPKPLLGIAVIAIIAAIISTIDTELFVLSSSIAKDFVGRRKKLSEKKMTRIIRMSLLALAVISMGIAIFLLNIITILFGLISMLLAISSTIVGSFFWKLKRNAVFISLCAGLASIVILFLLGRLNADTSIIVLPVALIFLGIGQLIFIKQKN